MLYWAHKKKLDLCFVSFLAMIFKIQWIVVICYKLIQSALSSLELVVVCEAIRREQVGLCFLQH